MSSAPDGSDVPIDVMWLATSGAGAAWAFLNEVQGRRDDVEAAYAESDWGTTGEAVLELFRAIAHCEFVLDGRGGVYSDVELDLSIARGTSPACAALREFPEVTDVDQQTVEELRGAAHVCVEELAKKIPIEVPVFRSSEGFFPTLKIAEQVERLRKHVGLEPMDWLASSAT